jgi:hypothetical protein
MMRKPVIFIAITAFVALGAILSLRADWSTVAEGVAMQTTMLAPSSDREPPLVASEREPVQFSGAYRNDGIIDQSRLASTSDAVEVVSSRGTVRVMLTEGDGEVVFDMDPSTNTTVLGRGAVIPPIHVTRGEEPGVDVLVIENPAVDAARQLLASKLKSSERLDANVFHRGDLAVQGSVVR